jgi:hypothetical protein
MHRYASVLIPHGLHYLRISAHACVSACMHTYMSRLIPHGLHYLPGLSHTYVCIHIYIHEQANPSCFALPVQISLLKACTCRIQYMYSIHTYIHTHVHTTYFFYAYIVLHIHVCIHTWTYIHLIVSLPQSQHDVRTYVYVCIYV